MGRVTSNLGRVTSAPSGMRVLPRTRHHPGRPGGLEYDDLVPQVIWRGTDFSYLHKLDPCLRASDLPTSSSTCPPRSTSRDGSTSARPHGRHAPDLRRARPAMEGGGVDGRGGARGRAREQRDASQGQDKEGGRRRATEVSGERSTVVRHQVRGGDAHGEEDGNVGDRVLPSVRGARNPRDRGGDVVGNAGSVQVSHRPRGGEVRRGPARSRSSASPDCSFTTSRPQGTTCTTGWNRGCTTSP